jgi:hypothetical protein
MKNTIFRLFQYFERDGRAAYATCIIAGIVYNLFLQIGLCRSMGSFVELKNRIILGSIVLPSLLCGIMYLAETASNAFEKTSVRFRTFFILFTAFLAILSPFVSIFYSQVHLTDGVVVLISLIISAGVFLTQNRTAISASSLLKKFGRALKAHVPFILVVPIFFLVFLCEIKDQWDVYEADGPYYGMFAKNILRYDLSHTFLLRTHGTGDKAEPITASTHNIRHPPGYIWHVAGWYLLFGSELSREGDRMLPILSNFGFILLLYLFVLKKTKSKNIAVCALLFYIMIPIASTFGNKIHQLSIAHLMILLALWVYDKLLDGSKAAMRQLFVIAVFSLLLDWYLFFLWPLIWLHYLWLHKKDKAHYPVRFLYLLPAVCIVTCVLIFGQMFFGAKNMGNFEFIMNLRFASEYVKRFSMENFNAALSQFVMRDYTKFVTQIGIVWPVLFFYRVLKRKADRLDIFTFILLIYALINIYLFQKIFIHYFEVIHFLMYAILACTLTLNYLYQWASFLGVSRHVLFPGIIVLAMFSDTVDGIRYFRLRHSGAYTDGYAEATEYILERIQKNEIVVVNNLFNIYSNERHTITNNLVMCRDMKCFKKVDRNKRAAYVILFDSKSDDAFIKQILTKGRVRIFHDHVAVVELKKPGNIIMAKDSKEVRKLKKPPIKTPLGEGVELLGYSLPKKVDLKTPSLYEEYFYSLNDDKYPERKYPELVINYYYKRVENHDLRAERDAKKSRSMQNVDWATKVLKSDGTLIKSQTHPLTCSFYQPSLWPKNRIVHETVSIFLDEDATPGEYTVQLSAENNDYEIGRFYLGQDEIQLSQKETKASPQKTMDSMISKSLFLVGVDMEESDVSPGDTVHIHTYYQKREDVDGAPAPFINIREVLGGDLTKSVELDPLPFLKKDVVYQYTTKILIPYSAEAGKKQVNLSIDTKSVSLGTLNIHSPRQIENIVVETIDKTTTTTKGGFIRRRNSGIRFNEDKIQIDFSSSQKKSFQLILEAEYGEKPSGYIVTVDTKRTINNGSPLQVIASDVIEETVLSSARYHRVVPIPDALFFKGQNRLIIEPFVVNQLNHNYPGWRRAFFTLFAPIAKWILQEDISSEMPAFSYIAVDTRN